MPAVTGLCIYPVKGLKGINVSSAPICETGFVWDRQWLITRPDGRFLTQRQIPKMTLVVTSLPQEALNDEWGDLSPDAALTLNAPGMEPLHVPLKVSKFSEADLKQCTCWEWSGLAMDEGEDAAAWLTKFLGKPVRLVRYVGQLSEGPPETDPKRRPCPPDFGPGAETMFADAFPYLVTTESSLKDLNSKLAEPMDMNRFRSNIIIDDSVAPWDEDNWQSFTLSGAPDRAITFQSLKPCGRCKVTTTNQETGEVGKEPLMTLGKYRTGKALGWSAMASWKHEIFFGWNFSADASGTIAVGDELKVTKTRTAPMTSAA